METTILYWGYIGIMEKKMETTIKSIPNSEDLEPIVRFDPDLVACRNWVAVKELKLNYYIGETLLFTIYTHYGNLI